MCRFGCFTKPMQLFCCREAVPMLYKIILSSLAVARHHELKEERI
ncbi:2-dehydropantoate 2-reductase [Prevotella nigrescens ATCC 33563]|nr:2-dehydropantoate 2-reductase [Prevotella nigrescens ATCC 33563]